MSIGLLPSFITWLSASLLSLSLSLSLFLSVSLAFLRLSFSFPRSSPTFCCTLIRTPRRPRQYCLCLSFVSALWSSALRHDDAAFRETQHAKPSVRLYHSSDHPEIHPSWKPREVLRRFTNFARATLCSSSSSVRNVSPKLRDAVLGKSRHSTGITRN